MDPDALFFQASPNALARGLVQDGSAHVCLICLERFEDGCIYELEGKLFEAHRGAAEHVRLRHGHPATWLLALDKRLSGLSDIQKKLFSCLLAGKDDRDTALEMGITPSTVRNHRFQLREREKQARVFLALMRLLESVPKGGEALVESHRTATMVDERWAITQEELTEYTARYFPEGPAGPIAEFPAKEKRKLVILMQLAKRFAPDHRYTEKEVNQVLKAAWHDFATLRRYLIEYGFLDRERDGSAYWVKQ
jgi:DNA-binding CsgD family transcriptional regulator